MSKLLRVLWSEYSAGRVRLALVLLLLLKRTHVELPPRQLLHDYSANARPWMLMLKGKCSGRRDRRVIGNDSCRSVTQPHLCQLVWSVAIAPYKLGYRERRQRMWNPAMARVLVLKGRLRAH